MIDRSVSLQRRLEREALRCAGSLARLVFYAGTMPSTCEFRADGDRIEAWDAPDFRVREIYQGIEPELPPGATYWRLLDNNGNVVMQGNGHG
jgi:hypothetical protein